MHRKLTDNEKKVYDLLTAEEKKLLKTLTDDDASLYLKLTPNQRKSVGSLDLKQRRSWFDEYGKRVAWAEAMRKTIRDDLYPIILEVEGSLADTQQFLSMVEMYVSQASVNYAQKLTLEKLKVLERLDDNYPYINQLKKIFNLLNKESVSDVSMIIKGFNDTIEAILKKEATQRPFKDLNIEWDKV